MENFITLESLAQFEEAKEQKTIFLFTTDWCPDCIFIKPFIGDLAMKNPEFTYYYVDRDDHIDICRDLDILGIPSFVAFDKGEETGRFVSKLRKTKDEIQAFIDSVK